MQLARVDESILLVKVGDEAGAKVAAVALGREVEPAQRLHEGWGDATWRTRTDSLLANFANSPLSKRIWKASQTKGAAASVLLTVSVPKEKPVPMGWSM